MVRANPIKAKPAQIASRIAGYVVTHNNIAVTELVIPNWAKHAIHVKKTAESALTDVATASVMTLKPTNPVNKTV